MTKDSKKVVTEKGEVKKTLPNASFEVELDSGGKMIARLSGKMRHFRIKVLPGDRVKVERSPHDKTKGRIVYRL